MVRKLLQIPGVKSETTIIQATFRRWNKTKDIFTKQRTLIPTPTPGLTDERGHSTEVGFTLMCVPPYLPYYSQHNGSTILIKDIFTKQTMLGPTPGLTDEGGHSTE
ncbi:hypothetical protein J6590_071737, partial [Homalodisca vitripennis]